MAFEEFAQKVFQEKPPPEIVIVLKRIIIELLFSDTFEEAATAFVNSIVSSKEAIRTMTYDLDETWKKTKENLKIIHKYNTNDKFKIDKFLQHLIKALSRTQLSFLKTKT